MVLLVVIFAQNKVHSQSNDETEWVEKNYFEILKKIMPIVKRPLYSIGVRSFEDFYTDGLENSFILHRSFKTNKVTAVYRAAHGKSIYDQLILFHNEFPKETAEHLTKKLQFTEKEFTESTCPEIKKQFEAFHKITFPKSTIQSMNAGVIITLHPRIREIEADIIGGRIKLDLVNEENRFVNWSDGTFSVLRKCQSK